MKINRIQLGEALLTVTLDQFQSVPSEAEIEHTFSRGFQVKIQNITRKSESVAWRVWQTPVKRAVLIAVLIMIMLVTVACAMPGIRNAIIDFFFVEDEKAYGICIDPYETTPPLNIIENYYAPTFEPEGYTLILKEYMQSGVEFIWKNEFNEYIYYRQTVIQQGISDSGESTIDAEGTKRTTKNINGYLVEIISNEVEQQYVAVWTDNRYVYSVDISVKGSNQEKILNKIMDSIVEVKTIN